MHTQRGTHTRTHAQAPAALLTLVFGVSVDAVPGQCRAEPVGDAVATLPGVQRLERDLITAAEPGASVLRTLSPGRPGWGLRVGSET